LEGLNIDENRYIQNHLNHQAFSNISSNNAQNLNNITMNTSKYLQEVNNIDAFSNISADISAKNIEELYDNGRVSVKDNIIQYKKESGITPGYTFLNEVAQPILEMRNPQFEVNSQISDSRIYKRIDHDNSIDLERNTPLTNFATNITKLEDFNSMNLSSREYKLDPLLKKGAFNNIGHKPTVDREDLIYVRENDKDKLRRRINDNQFNRYG
jgi:hypothetical protein